MPVGISRVNDRTLFEKRTFFADYCKNICWYIWVSRAYFRRFLVGGLFMTRCHRHMFLVSSVFNQTVVFHFTLINCSSRSLISLHILIKHEQVFEYIMFKLHRFLHLINNSWTYWQYSGTQCQNKICCREQTNILQLWIYITKQFYNTFIMILRPD